MNLKNWQSSTGFRLVIFFAAIPGLLYDLSFSIASTEDHRNSRTWAGCLTKANHWDHLPMSEKNTLIPMEIKFSKEEFDRIRLGFRPEEMEDKWFIYADQTKDGHIYMHRSWTGIMIFDILFREEKDGSTTVYGARALRDPSLMSVIESEDHYDIVLIQHWFSVLNMLNQEYANPRKKIFCKMEDVLLKKRQRSINLPKSVQKNDPKLGDGTSP